MALTLMVVSIGLTSALTWVQNQRIPGIDATAGEIPFLWRLLGNLIPLLFTILAFAVVYKIVPNCVISWRSAFLGALFAGIFWEGAKYVFAYYASHYANFGKVYGSLGVVVSLMFWSYYTASNLIQGGEKAAGRGTHAPQSHPPPPKPEPRPLREREETEPDLRPVSRQS